MNRFYSSNIKALKSNLDPQRRQTLIHSHTQYTQLLASITAPTQFNSEQLLKQGTPVIRKASTFSDTKNYSTSAQSSEHSGQSKPKLAQLAPAPLAIPVFGDTPLHGLAGIL